MYSFYCSDSQHAFFFCYYAAECEMNYCTGYYLTSSCFSLHTARIWLNFTPAYNPKRKPRWKSDFYSSFEAPCNNFRFWNILREIAVNGLQHTCTCAHLSKIGCGVEVGVSLHGVELLLELDSITFMGIDWSRPAQWNQLDSPKSANPLQPPLQTCEKCAQCNSKDFN